MATKVYIAREAPVVWSDSAGDLVLTLNALGVGAGRIGARKDLGAASTSYQYSWRFTCQFDDEPVVGETINLYLCTSDGTRPDGELGVADAALAAEDKMKNLYHIGNLIVDVATKEIDFTSSGVCTIPTRYVSPVVWNNTVDVLENVNDVSEFTLTPIPFESQ